MIQILEKPEIRRMAMPMSVEQYHRLSASGVVPEPTELLRGVVIEKMSKSPLHVYIVRWLYEWLSANIAGDLHVRQEQPLTFADSEPEPDIAVVEGAVGDFRNAHPDTARFIIEVAIASHELDREKGAVYAEAGVPEFWIVLPEERAIEIYTAPSSQGYQQMQRHEDVDAPLTSTVFSTLSLTPRELFS